MFKKTIKRKDDDGNMGDSNTIEDPEYSDDKGAEQLRIHNESCTNVVSSESPIATTTKSLGQISEDNILPDGCRQEIEYPLLSSMDNSSTKALVSSSNHSLSSPFFSIKLSMAIKSRKVHGMTKTKTQSEFQDVSAHQESENGSQNNVDDASLLVIPCSTSDQKLDKWKQRLAMSTRHRDPHFFIHHDTTHVKSETIQDSESSPTLEAVISNSNTHRSGIASSNTLANESDHYSNTNILSNNQLAIKAEDAIDNQVNPDVDDDKTAAMAILSAINAMDGSDNNATTKLVIATSTKNTNIKVKDETEQMRNEIQSLPDDIPVTSNIYQAVPISQFGAAMLRGMGWNDDDNENRTNKNTKAAGDANNIIIQRPHRLGIGAIPAVLEPDLPESASHFGGKNVKIKTQDRYQRDKILKIQQEEFIRQKETKIALDVQVTIQNGSIIFVNTENGSDYDTIRRAKVIQLVGMPGLNRVKIQYENDINTTVIKRSEMGQLVQRDELLRNPFQIPAVEEYDEQQNSAEMEEIKDNRFKNKGMDNRRNHSTDIKDNKERSREYSKNQTRNVKDADRRSNGDEKSREKPKKVRKYDEYDHHDRNRNRSTSDHSYSRNHEDDVDHRMKNKSRHDVEDEERKKRKIKSSSKRREDDRHYETTKTKKDVIDNRSKMPVTWMIPNIRVRIITNRYGEEHYKRKGIIIDVTSKGATVEIPNASSTTPLVLDHVRERYLETVIPPIGGTVVILSKENDHYLSKGHLIEKQNGKRSDYSSVGIIQLVEDLNVVSLSLDDIAEWCGHNHDE